MPEGRNLRMVGLGGIGVMDNRLRKLRPEVVDELAQSIRVQGLLHPITLRLRSKRGIGYLLVAGRHRLEAVRKLGWDNIRAEIVDEMTADAAQLAEIDENLVRADLTLAERAAHTAARKPLYEKLHGKAKAKGAEAANQKMGRGGKAKDASANLADAFTTDTSKKTGKSERKVQRDVHRGEKIVVLAEVTGTCLDKSDELDALAKLKPAEQRSLAERAAAGDKVSAKTRVKQIRRDSRERELAQKQSALPLKKYGVILADPEWRFEPWSRETGLDRSADNHYPTSVTEVIAARPVASIAADDCVLFLWATVPMLPHALLVMSAWGFDYRSHFIWAKDQTSTGYWNRNRHEILLVGVRGDVPAPAPGTQWDSLIPAAVAGHSVKPRCFVEMIDEHFPTLPKIELNCRGQPWSGWDAWGNETSEVEHEQGNKTTATRNDSGRGNNGDHTSSGAVGSTELADLELFQASQTRGTT